MIFTARLRQARNADTLRAPVIAALLLACLLVCLLPLAAQAKKSDRKQPVKVSAKSADALAKPNGVSHLKGDVVIIQGTLKVTGDSATIHFDSDSKVNRVVLTGAPAHLQQVDDNGNLVKGHADNIDYNVPKGVAVLTGEAYVKQAGRGSASGDKLVYNTETSTMTAQSKGDNRVHLTFRPHQVSSSDKAAPAPATSSGGN